MICIEDNNIIEFTALPTIKNEYQNFIKNPRLVIDIYNKNQFRIKVNNKKYIMYLQNKLLPHSSQEFNNVNTIVEYNEKQLRKSLYGLTQSVQKNLKKLEYCIKETYNLEPKHERIKNSIQDDLIVEISNTKIHHYLINSSLLNINIEIGTISSLNKAIMTLNILPSRTVLRIKKCRVYLIYQLNIYSIDKVDSRFIINNLKDKFKYFIK